MAVGFVNNQAPIEDRVGTYTVLHLRLNLGAYVTDGVDFDPSLYGEGSTCLIAHVQEAGGYSFQYDYTNKQIEAYVVATGAEVANATDLSALDVRAEFHLRQ